MKSGAGVGPAVTVQPRRPSFGAASNEYTLVYGKKGQGKTLLLRDLYLRRVRAGGRATFIDRTGRNGDLGRVVESVGAWYAVVRAALAQGRGFSLVVQPGRGVELDPLWAMCWELGEMLVAIDEAEAYADSSRIDRELAHLVNLGRNRQVDIAVTVRTPPQLNGAIRGNADTVITFCQPFANYARDLCAQFFPDLDYRLLMRLPRFHYLRTDGDVVTRGRVHLPGS